MSSDRMSPQEAARQTRDKLDGLRENIFLVQKQLAELGGDANQADESQRLRQHLAELQAELVLFGDAVGDVAAAALGAPRGAQMAPNRPSKSAAGGAAAVSTGASSSGPAFQSQSLPSGNVFESVWAYVYRLLGSNATLQQVFQRMESLDGVQLSPAVQARIEQERLSRAQLLDTPGSAGDANQDYWETEKKSTQVQRQELLEEYGRYCDGIDVSQWTAPHIRGPVIISMYAEKGGVGKSTATSSLAWALAAAGKRVLMIDCDGQRSLSKWILDQQLGPHQTLSEFIEEQAAVGRAEREVNRNNWIAAHPEFDGPMPEELLEPLFTLHEQLGEARQQASKVRAATPLPVPNRPNLFLVAGHSRIHDMDRDLNLQEGLSLSNGSAVTLTGAPYHAIMASANAIDADVVLLDLNPISSTLNRCLVMASHYLLIPGIPDFSTKEMLTEMSDILPRWRKEWDAIRALTKRTVHPLPQHLPKFLGYMLIRYQARKFGPMRSGVTQDSLAVNEREWLVRVEQAADALQQRLLPENMALDRASYVRTGRSVCLAMIRDFFQLGDLSGHFHVPVSFLGRRHLIKLQRDRATGALREAPIPRKELGDLQLRVHMFFLIFKAIADNIFQLIRDDGAAAAPLSQPPSIPGLPSRASALAALSEEDPEWFLYHETVAASLQHVDAQAELNRLEQAVAAAQPPMALRPDELTRGDSFMDGSCQFLAIADQEMLMNGVDQMTMPIAERASRRMDRARQLRELAVQRILADPNLQGVYLKCQVDRFRKDSEFGDPVTLRAMALELNVRVCIYSSRHPARPININKKAPSDRMFCIGHVFESHYRSVVQRGEFGDVGASSASAPAELPSGMSASALSDDDDDDADMMGTKVIMSETESEEEDSKPSKRKKRKSAK